MKSDALFEDLKHHTNISVIEKVNNNIREEFKEMFNDFEKKLFIEVIENCGGIIIDNWIRLYGCGDLNVVEKNKFLINKNVVDIFIGEDVIGGVFGLKDSVVYYFAPDTLKWECLEVYYANFMNWIINLTPKVDIFYKNYRWSSWKEDCKQLEHTQGILFYPFLFNKCNIEDRSRKIINVNEIIRMNFEIMEKV